MVAKFGEGCFADRLGLYPGRRAVSHKSRQRNLHPPALQRSPQGIPARSQRIRVTSWRDRSDKAQSLSQTGTDIAPAARRHADRARGYRLQPRRKVTRIGLDALERTIERAPDGPQRRCDLLLMT